MGAPNIRYHFRREKYITSF